METFKTVAREALGLFVADARFTLTLVAWMALAGAIPAALPHSPVAGALILFAGFAAILIENLLYVASNEARFPPLSPATASRR